MSAISRRAVLLLSIALIGCGTARTVSAQSKKLEDAPKRVRLVVDYGDGVQKHFTALAWHDGMTVLDAMQLAVKHPRGIKMKYRGKGATAFLTQIDELENEGAKRNWIYRVNDKLGDRSFAIQTLKPGDTILWKFGEYR